MPRFHFFAIAVFSALCCWGSPLGAAPPTDKVAVLSFNVRMSLAPEKDGENAWPLRKGFLIEVMRTPPEDYGGAMYDFIGTQEAVIHPDPALNQVKFIIENMPEYASIYLSREKTPERGEAMLLLYRKDRWKIDPNDQGTFWLSDTPDEPGSNTWKAGCPRVCTYGLFHELKGGKATGKKLYVYNTHYDHRSDLARQNSSVQMIQRFADRSEKTVPLVFMGDFNSREDSPQILYLQGKKVKLGDKEHEPPLALLDTFRAVRPEATDVGTYNSFKKPGTGKIDYIFTSEGLKPSASTIIRTQRDGKYPSDHFPLDALLEFAP